MRGCVKRIGVAKGIYWSPKKSDIFEIKTTIKKGSGKLLINGNIGYQLLITIENVIYLFKDRNLNKLDIEIKFPKELEGSSAGLPLFMSLYSALNKKSIDQSIAYTGEVNKSGSVLAVDAINEKILAAIDAGIKCIVIPRNNLDELPFKCVGALFCCVNKVKDSIEII